MVDNPGISIICPIDKSVALLKFVYKQVLKYTDLADKEFFFVVTGAGDAVLTYLRDHYIPHYVMEKTPEQKTEWYINSVYRAYNFGARKARGNFFLFIHSDMAFNPGWLDNLLKAYNGANCITPRLVESGKLPSGQYAIAKDFGRHPSLFRKYDFLQYVPEIALPEVAEGGSYIPLLIRQEHFDLAGGYPEGNPLSGSDLFQPVIAREGEPYHVGYEVFRRKLALQGITHQTVFSSVVYHFQRGETDEPETTQTPSGKKKALNNLIAVGINKYLGRNTARKRNCQVSILISTFQRPHLLKWGLYSLAKQDIPLKFETIVINDGVDDETEAICEEYREKLNLTYLFTGQRNLDGAIKWRVPGFSLNIGAKQSTGKFLVIACSEMFHLNDTIVKLINPLRKNPDFLGIPVGKDDTDGSFLRYIQEHGGNYDQEMFESCAALNVQLPFLLSVSRKHFFAIGGYDEDFTGIAYDDNDLVQRLQINGCSYVQTEAKTVHLFHPRCWIGREVDPGFLFNKNLFFMKKGKVVRNINREWGIR
ncbi:MAG: glycosyltransferase family 2 protein [Bacillota bacterium]